MNKFNVGDKVERVFNSASLTLGGVYEVSHVVNSDFIRLKGYEYQYDVRKFYLLQSGKYPNPPHKHAELIKAWADGADIEVKLLGTKNWHHVISPDWITECEYRIKPNKTPNQIKLEQLEEQVRKLADEIKELRDGS